MPSTYDNLPVFKAVYDLLLTTLDVCKRLTKDYRYSLGEDMKKRLFRIEVLVYRTNKEADRVKKAAHITEALELLVEVRLYYRILHDSKQLSTNRYAQIAFDMETVDKHLEQWRKYQQTPLTKDSPNPLKEGAQ